MGCARQLREAIESVSKKTISFRDKLIYFTLLCVIFNVLIIFDFPSNLDLNAKINAVIEAIILVSISCIIKPKWIKNLKLLVYSKIIIACVFTLLDIEILISGELNGAEFFILVGFFDRFCFTIFSLIQLILIQRCQEELENELTVLYISTISANLA